MELKKGTTLQNGKYEIVQLVGHGAFSFSYLAHEFDIYSKIFKRKVFIKEFFISQFSERNENKEIRSAKYDSTFKEYLRLFKTSFEYVSELNHPNIVKTLHIFEENSTCYCVYEYIEGENLDSYIKSKHPIDNREAFNIISQIGDAVQYIHSKGIIHLDIKPRNILRDNYGKVYLEDFEIARKVDSNGYFENDDYMSIGTPGYAPLEQISQSENVDNPACIDVYALSATFYKILTNQRPPDAASVVNDGIPLDILQKDGRPDVFINGIVKGMSFNRKKRFQTAEEFIVYISSYTPDVKSREKDIIDALPVGTVLTGNTYRYTIEKVLDQGAFGITYKASVKMEGTLGALDTGVTVAIKEFFMEKINGRENTIVTGSKKNGTFSYYKEKFIKEAISLSKLNHPNIVKVVEQFEANNTAYYVMEFIAGGSLDKKIAVCGKLSETQIINYTRQIGAALQFMHSKHMLHLDLKPKNVMLTDDDTVKLIDFGLSKQFDDSGKPETSTTIGNGTPGYAPLEQSNYSSDSGDFPATMDVYALGATIFKMATGHRPPDASDILNDGFPSDELTGLSDNMNSIVMKAMSPIKKRRYQRVTNLLKDIETNDSEETTNVDESVHKQDNKIKSSNRNIGTSEAHCMKEESISNEERHKVIKSNLFKCLFFVIISISLFCLSKCFKDEPVNDDGIVVFNVDGNIAGHDYVDLGLPSGTLWATENINDNDSTGGELMYFEWGETKPKNSAYITIDTLVSVDHYLKGIIGTDSDVATLSWGKDWMLPSEEDFLELEKYCKIEWNESPKGVYFDGPNGNRIFFPVKGFMSNSESNIEDDNRVGYYLIGKRSKPSPFEDEGMVYTITKPDELEVRVIHITDGLTVRPVSKGGAK